MKVGSNPADSEEDENDLEEWMYDSKGSRKWVAHCGDCAYKSTRQNLENHVKSNHPNSTTALPPRPPSKYPEKLILKQCPHCEYNTMSKKEMERHEINHRTKFAHQCTFCSFSANGWYAVSRHAKYYHSNTPPYVANNSQKVYKHYYSYLITYLSSYFISQEKTDNSSRKEKEEWHYRPNGSRYRYMFCRDCDYKSSRRAHIESHVKTLHPLSKTALPPPLRQPALYHCTLCQYKTHSKPYFDDHLKHHRKRYDHQCHLCSYSAKSSDIINRHLKNHHPNRQVYLK